MARELVQSEKSIQKTSYDFISSYEHYILIISAYK